MTFSELLKACAEGSMPRVSNGQITGKVVAIKDGDNYHGCAVDFDNGPGYSIWFHAEDGNDRRKNYMKDLKLI